MESIYGAGFWSVCYGYDVAENVDSDQDQRKETKIQNVKCSSQLMELQALFCCPHLGVLLPIFM